MLWRLADAAAAICEQLISMSEKAGTSRIPTSLYAASAQVATTSANECKSGFTLESGKSIYQPELTSCGTSQDYSYRFREQCMTVASDDTSTRPLLKAITTRTQGCVVPRLHKLS